MGKAMRQVTNLTQILADHRLWLGGKGGNRADLSCADLRGVSLSLADLRRVNLRGADLRDAVLWGADLHGASLSGADLRGADLHCTNFSYANLSRANLHGANLLGANFSYANLRGAGLIVLQLPIWVVYVHRETVRIGCQHHGHDVWRQFTDEEIERMDENALPWWRAHRSTIFAAMDEVASKQENTNE